MRGGHIVALALACVWLGCGATTQGEVGARWAKKTGPARAAPPPPSRGEAARCALSRDAASVACTVPGEEGARPFLFVREPGQPFVRTSLQPAGRSMYSARLPAAPSPAAEYYVALYADGRFAGATRLRRLSPPQQAPAASSPAAPAAPEAEKAAEVDRGRPPLSGGRIAAEVLLGGLFALPVAFGGGLLVDAIDDSECGMFCIPTPVLIGAYAGACVGASFGVWVAGSYGDQGGRFDATLLGGLVGGAAGVGLLVTAFDEAGPAALLFTLLPPFTAAVGFNLTRRYDEGSSPRSGWLLRVEDGQVALDLPIPFPDPTRRSLLVPLAAGRF